MVPDTIIAGKYRLVRHLGDGAMGSVWEAVNQLTQRPFAIKLIQKTTAGAADLRERMLREASAAGRLRHRNVIEVYDVGDTDEGDPFLVMELLHGETLDALMERRKRLSVAVTAAIGSEVAHALRAAHDAGIIHRDLKPANVFLHELEERGVVVKVLDFGVSKLVSDQNASATVTGTAIGSPAYMSPEQAVGSKGLDHRTDIWSLGVLLYEMASGRPAFDGETVFAIVADILHGDVPRLIDAVPTADPRLSSIIARCMERDVERRYRSARDVAADLETLLPRSSASVLADMDEDPTLSEQASEQVRARISALDARASVDAPPVSDAVQTQRRPEVMAPPGSGIDVPVAVVPAASYAPRVGAVTAQELGMAAAELPIAAPTAKRSVLPLALLAGLTVTAAIVLLIVVVSSLGSRQTGSSAASAAPAVPLPATVEATPAPIPADPDLEPLPSASATAVAPLPAPSASAVPVAPPKPRPYRPPVVRPPVHKPCPPHKIIFLPNGKKGCAE